jgi:hypothetical protein
LAMGIPLVGGMHFPFQAFELRLRLRSFHFEGFGPSVVRAPRPSARRGARKPSTRGGFQVN